MKLTINGETREMPCGTTGAGLLEKLNITPSTVVAELNREIMKRELFLEHTLMDGDTLELVTVVGGG